MAELSDEQIRSLHPSVSGAAFESIAALIEAARAECEDDHGAWREEIVELKSDVQMWKDLAAIRRAQE